MGPKCQCCKSVEKTPSLQILAGKSLLLWESIGIHADFQTGGVVENTPGSYFWTWKFTWELLLNLKIHLGATSEHKNSPGSYFWTLKFTWELLLNNDHTRSASSCVQGSHLLPAILPSEKIFGVSVNFIFSKMPTEDFYELALRNVLLLNYTI